MNDTNIITSIMNNDSTTIEGVIDVVETTNNINDSLSESESDVFKWTWVTIIQSIVLFLLAGVAEIIGGWMVWYVVTTVVTTVVTVVSIIDTSRSLFLLFVSFLTCRIDCI
jgi:hypothetical protein